MREIDASIVAFRPDPALFQQLLDSLAEPTRSPSRVNLLVHDNTPGTESAARIGQWAAARGFDPSGVQRSPSNVGFGRGHNANAARGKAPLLLVINQDCVLEPGALDVLLEAVDGAEPDVAAWELRQIPYEHPKAYDPVTLETSWVSGAATLLRREAFDQVRGFEPRIFLYGEDVDLSWRLRARNWRLTYQPRAGVVHRTYREAGEVKPLQVFGGVTASLCLRARFGGFARTLQGLVMLAGEILAPPSFPGRRRGLAKAGLRFLAQWPYFAATRTWPTHRFQPFFAGWGYEERREGAFVEMASARDGLPRPRPLVSILIRTIGRQAWLAQALASCANQTYRPLEVVVVEDGPETSRALVESFAPRMDVRYVATGRDIGRAAAGNRALAEARGEWLNFLDDDDVLFADHVEALVDAVYREAVVGAYALAWETRTRVVDRERARYEEVENLTRHHQRFDRITLWHHNYLPIQAVMFHRRLYERHGGFAEDMDQLEDWNLWTRYTLQDDFLLVEKTTSKYRVPAESHVAAGRQALLDRAYADALERQRQLRLELSPREISDMVDAYVRSQSLVMVTTGDLRSFVRSRPVLSRIAAYRPTVARVWRRLRGRR